MPTELEDPSTQDKRDYLNDRIESTLNETLDRICKPAN
jgi:D-alanyl-D-alanine carboxypeptidase